MTGIVGVAALLTVLALSLLITRLATVALTHTGMSTQAARFQARSAFTGTGFTTSEAEQVVQHPVRRRIVMTLMVLRSAGLVTIILSLILSFVGSGSEGSRLLRLAWLSGGILLLWLLSLSRVVDRAVSRLMERALRRWTDLDVRDYANLLRVAGEYTVMEMKVREGDWLAGKPLEDSRLPDEGVTVLGIYRSNGSYLGVPQGATEVNPDDTLVLYGRGAALAELDRRRADVGGEEAHRQAVQEQRREVSEEQRQDRERGVRREA